MGTLETAKDTLERILALMNFPAAIEGVETDETVTLTITSQEDANIIIGKKGKNLDALQFLVNRIVQKKTGERKRVILDSEDYRERRQAALESRAREIAEIVRTSGRPAALDDLNPRERWIIHVILRSEAGVKTESVGEGAARKLMVLPDTGEKKDL